MPNHVIVGDGPAGITAAQVIRERDPEATITVLSADVSPHYYRAALTNYLIGQLRDDELWGVPPDFYFRHRIGRFYGRVVGVDTARAAVQLENGQVVPYDTLLLAAGSSPTRLTVPGADLPGVVTFRTLQDARRLVDLLPDLRQAVITGAGTLGLEWVQGLREKGVEVTYILRDRSFMPRVLDATASEIVFRKLRAAGVTLVLEDEIAAIQPWQGWVGQVVTKAGRQIPCQLVGAAIGVRPNTDFLRGSAIKTERGVLTDEYLQTSVPNVFAAGDIAQARDPRLQRHQPPPGLWQPAREQGRVAGQNMAVGRPERAYDPGALSTATHLYELDFAAVGETNPRGADIETITFRPEPEAYQKVVLRDGRVIGALLIGPRKNARVFKTLIDRQLDVSPVRARLLDPHFDLVGWTRQQLATSEARRLVQTGLGVRLPVERAAQGGADLAVDPRLATAPLFTAVPAPKLAARLVHEGREFVVRAEGPTLLGRELTCDVVLANTTVSRRHAEIVAGPGGYTIRDLGSANGTWVGLTRVQGEHGQPLQPGDVLRLGEVYLTFTLSERAAAAPRAGAASLSGPTGDTPLTNEITSLGRGSDNDIVIHDAQVSRLHAQIPRSGDGFYLRDMGSANGTRVNGARLFDAHRLRDGDTIQIGVATFTFHQASQRAATPDSAASVIELVAVAGSSAGTRFSLQAGDTTLGRAADNAIVLNDPLVTRHHAVLTVAGSSLTVRDLGSANGTWVDGERLTAPRALRDGDRLEIGQTQFTVSERRGVADTTHSSGEPAGATRLIDLAGLGDGAAARAVGEPILTIVGGAGDGTRFPLRPGLAATAGRDAANPIHLADSRASRRHAEFAVAPTGTITVRDLGSSNGTIVNGEAVAGSRELGDGDRITIGDTVLRLTVSRSG